MNRDMHTRRSAFLLILYAAVSLSSCDENAIRSIAGPAPGARIKFFNFGVNARSVNFYANGVKITAISSATGTESTTGTTYSTAAIGGFYAAIAPGQYTFEGRIAATDTAISSVSATVADGKHYSFYQSGFYNATTKTVEAFLVEDNFPPEIDYSVAHVRFVHAISNANPMTLYAKSTSAPADTTAGVAVGGAVAYKSAGAFTPLPGGVYNLSTRYAGSATNAIVSTDVSFSAGKVYTVTAFGDITVTSTTATNRPRLNITANR
jgi:Domain of unknown function (DUF4397)